MRRSIRFKLASLLAALIALQSLLHGLLIILFWQIITLILRWRIAEVFIRFNIYMKKVKKNYFYLKRTP